MCGRFNLWSTSIELTEFFNLIREPVAWSPRYNIGPMQRVLIVREKPDRNRIAELVQWGLVPGWANVPSIGFEMINARCETIFTKFAFRGAFRRRRCLIPATGFYEWQQLTDEKKRPWHIFPKDGQPIAFAGLWEQWRASDRTTLGSCSIITTQSNRLMRGIHDRMPVILAKEKWSSWLNPAQDNLAGLAKLLVPCPNTLLEKTAVGDFVNGLRNDSPECIRSVQTSQP